jgi:hypothetical protein
MPFLQIQLPRAEELRLRPDQGGRPKAVGPEKNQADLQKIISPPFNQSLLYLQRQNSVLTCSGQAALAMLTVPRP